jgi:hypothetical protein
MDVLTWSACLEATSVVLWCVQPRLREKYAPRALLRLGQAYSAPDKRTRNRRRRYMLVTIKVHRLARCMRRETSATQHGSQEGEIGRLGGQTKIASCVAKRGQTQLPTGPRHSTTMYAWGRMPWTRSDALCGPRGREIDGKTRLCRATGKRLS